MKSFQDARQIKVFFTCANTMSSDGKMEASYVTIGVVRID